MCGVMLRYASGTGITGPLVFRHNWPRLKVLAVSGTCAVDDDVLLECVFAMKQLGVRACVSCMFICTPLAFYTLTHTCTTRAYTLAASCYVCCLVWILGTEPGFAYHAQQGTPLVPRKVLCCMACCHTVRQLQSCGLQVRGKCEGCWCQLLQCIRFMRVIAHAPSALAQAVC